MKKHLTLKKISITLLCLIIAIQLIRIDKNNPPAPLAKDFLQLHGAPGDIQELITTSCYDCHSNQSIYPWYSNVAPVSWWIKHHVNEGREHLNFSEWAAYSDEKADHKLEECIEMIEEGKMPMNSYTLMHKNAQLSEAQKLTLLNWFSTLREPGANEKDLSAKKPKNYANPAKLAG